ncbi:NF038130 family PEP-CTERM protein [Microcoleus sp. FACHB-831]|uniref:NF038130 family PEP-CTERM protein n=1 Tax=Microcoleus sp. FACHB-831 TaxID=2692827 RepID=UPI0016869938|nr:NF038130 family PEP-CTERM protein [Microcoleus sp. FACHB-831]MBD1923118.1 NF038130 family PEP-CTERM protein [Microcoleus sp. FACHB-831]
MVGIVKKFLIGASVAAGMSAIATAPAFAGTLTGATIGGTAASDYYVYDSDGTNTFLVPNNAANVQKALSGNAASPTGNVELRRSSEQANFDFTKNTTLTGQIGGKDITLSSLTESDWFGAGPKTYGQTNLANKWFNDFITKAGYGGVVGSGIAANMYTSFFGLGGFQASSDPNISYVNQNDSTGEISIGLAGHFNLKEAYANSPKFASFASLLPNGFQASEVVKYTYDGKTDYLYSFLATNSGLVNGAGQGADGKSHNGNYEVKMPGSKAVPEPSSVLALMALGGILASKRKLMKQA